MPDLAEFGVPQANKFRQVLRSMNEELRTKLIQELKRPRRDLPLGSYVNLPKIYRSLQYIPVLQLWTYKPQ